MLVSSSSSGKMNDKPEWFGFFPPEKERTDSKSGRYSKEALRNQFGDVVCLPCVVSRQGPPQCFKWCPCPNAQGHEADGEAHNTQLIQKCRKEWAKIKAEEREKDFRWTA